MFFFFYDENELDGVTPSLVGTFNENEIDVEAVKDELQKESDKQGLRNNDISEITGWSASKTSKITSGKQKATADDIRTWARSLGYSPDPFIDGSADLRTYNLNGYIRPMPDVFEAYFDSMNDNVTKAIVKYEMPLAMLTTLGVTVSDYAIRANSSFYGINIKSGRKHGENATYVKFWHRSTRTKGETTPKFGVWISPGDERFLFVAYIERDEIDEELVKERSALKNVLMIDESDTDDFDNYARNNQDWIPRYVRTGEIFSFGTDTSSFPESGVLEDAFIRLFKEYCNLVWEVKGIDLLPERLKLREDLSNPQKVSILSGDADFYYEVKDEVRARENYKCENNPMHQSFIDETGHQYMEVVPLIPFLAGHQFGKAIMSEKNGLCLCPMCKAQFYHGTKADREDMIFKLYRKHENDLKEAGIDYSLVQVMSCNNL